MLLENHPFRRGYTSSSKQKSVQTLNITFLADALSGCKCLIVNFLQKVYKQLIISQPSAVGRQPIANNFPTSP